MEELSPKHLIHQDPLEEGGKEGEYLGLLPLSIHLTKPKQVLLYI